MADNLFISIFICASLVIILGVVGMAVWAEDRKRRDQHEERMLALQRGLLPPEWVGDPWRNRRRAWLSLCIGLPTLIGCALAWGTFRLVEASTHARDFTSLLIFIWLIGGAVGLAAVILGGLGLLDVQRREFRQRPPVNLPDRGDLPGRMPQDQGASDHIWKQERP
jgi:hypothetical protein